MPLARRTTLAALLSAPLAAAGCRRQEAAGGPLRLLLNWFPEVEHGGFFAAQVHGYFAEAGLEVEIIAGRPDAPVLPQIASGRGDLGVADASELLLARAQKAPVVALFAALQHNPRCVLVHEGSGIERLADLGRATTLAMAVREPFAHFLRREVDLKAATVVPYTGSVAPFLADPGLAQQAYVFSEPLVVAQRGGAGRCLMVSELGFDPYASLLVCAEDRLADRPRLQAIARAVQRGWEHYLRDPAATNAEIAARNPEMDPDLLARGAAALAPLATPPAGAPLGSMTLGRWSTLADQLVALGLVDDGAIDPAKAFVDLLG
ncbi:MAG: ABC transporter substrate-binding protein [Myxococcales bacterium]|nr:ABC transporter substrate-binding protein [Myxococcales bacterium]